MATDRGPLTPRECKTFADVCSMPRDNVSTDEHWILFDGDTVTIAAQRAGEPSSQKVGLPRRTFEAFIDWYNTGKFRKPRKKVRRAD